MSGFRGKPDYGLTWHLPPLLTLSGPRPCQKSVDLSQWPPAVRVKSSGMIEPQPEKRAAPKPTHLEEARRVIEEYIANLREIIKKLRQKMN
ncbi:MULTISPECIES: hypothetical protein [Bradyrhizobium]|uniref:Uncharacterized protein n=1 Tax=Bradyrhizobium ottawaense TaxID=931866 RepID=A0ABV4FK45_9BRAD|nr:MULTISPECIES: hypothetical protein [Bradyrhizobium]MBR1295016.1 hypothetical protein [Bradyrhizobium ottawaense]WLB44708.1 hypothetical protein QIH93_29880 [Bradyrhizobium ottawaense]WQN82005.1 hypothetical protein U7859_34340 [Bradyrhizobium ottawaense]GMO10605.1 hypothetical protein BwSH20_74330 [Bradyrhizobium ottawaense]GMO53091.1 hypothetical protein BwSH14_76230 [Bradyrhizobium ottawaense]